jgi:hypothetical protein
LTFGFANKDRECTLLRKAFGAAGTNKRERNLTQSHEDTKELDSRKKAQKTQKKAEGKISRKDAKTQREDTGLFVGAAVGQIQLLFTNHLLLLTAKHPPNLCASA